MITQDGGAPTVTYVEHRAHKGGRAVQYVGYEDMSEPGQGSPDQVAPTAGLIFLAPDGTIEEWDPAAAAMYGYTSAEITGHPSAEIEAPSERGRLQQLAAGQPGEFADFESEHLRRDGTKIAVDVTVVPLPSPAGTVGRTACRVRDQSALRRAAMELERLHDAAPAGHDAIISIDLGGWVRHWNVAAERLFGLTASEAVGRQVDSLAEILSSPSAATERGQTAMKRLLEGESQIVYETWGRNRDGGAIEIRIACCPWRVDGRMVGMTVTAIDISELKRAQRLAQIINSSNDGVMSIDLDGRVTSWNAGAERMFGYPAAQIVGAPVTGLIPAERVGQFDAMRALMRSGAPGTTFDTTRLDRDGQPVSVSIVLSPLLDEENTLVGLSAVLRDISERTRADEMAARLAAIAASSGEALIGTDLDRVITSWNPAAERMTGFVAAEALGRPILEILPSTGPEDDLAGVRAAVLAGETVTDVERVRRRSDGGLIDVSLTMAPVRDASGSVIGTSAAMRDISEAVQARRSRERMLRELNEAQRMAKIGSWNKDLRSGRTTWSDLLYEMLARDPSRGPASWEEFNTYVHPDDRPAYALALERARNEGLPVRAEIRITAEDGTEREVLSIAQPHPDADGQLAGMLQDITEQRRVERDRLELIEREAAAAAANRAKSDFLARMSHELRTPLNSIIGFGQLLELKVLPEREHRDAELIVKAGKHLLSLIDEVLDISRLEAGRVAISLEPVPIKGTVDEVLTLLQPIASARGVALDGEGVVDANLHVLADRNRLKQVLLNIVSNAIKYNREAGTVRVWVDRGPASRMRISVADTGIGIRHEHLDKLFEPFERLGADQMNIEGTGLGLALSKGFVEAMDGSIEVQSTPGLGTTMTIDLRAAEGIEREPEGNAPGLPGLISCPGTSWRILYIEDNLANLTLMERVFEGSDVELLPAVQGGLGIELAREHPPDLVILDLHLPDMPGTEVLQRLKSDRPDTPVLILTADVTKAQAGLVKRLGAADLLTKPLDIARFIEVVNDCLGARLD